MQTDLNLQTSEIIATYVYKRGLIDGDYSFSTAVGLFNTVVNVILLIRRQGIVRRHSHGSESEKERQTCDLYQAG